MTPTLAELEQAKIDAEVALDMLRGMYTNAQLRAMTDPEFENWKQAMHQHWEAVVNAQLAYYRAVDAQEQAS